MPEKEVMGAKLELLTNSEMALADSAAVKGGVPSLTLMENAGQGVADCAATMLKEISDPAAPIAILCGPGNNGGDGFVAARHLKKSAHTVRVGLNGDIQSLKGDARSMAERWDGGHTRCDSSLLSGCGLVIDAIFGAGLTRPIEPKSTWGNVIDAVNAGSAPVLSVDVPSGLNGTTGEAAGAAIQAARTITFFRAKPGHLLYPGRALCGDVIIADIGIPEHVLDTLDKPDKRQRTWRNAPSLWLAAWGPSESQAHKYTHGHTVVVSGPTHKTGAARLAARAALRIGSGLVTVASPQDAAAENAAHLTAIMLEPINGARELQTLLSDVRKNACVIGPGCGAGDRTCELVTTVLKSTATAVLDADALTSFAAKPTVLFKACQARPDKPVIITPHEGEFARLFPDLKTDKLQAARAAAERSVAIVVLKGADTVVAAPDGRAAINDNAPPWLATAGSGDVLAGFIAGLCAQNMEAFSAACAGVWLHGDCASQFGRGLIAEDLPELLPASLSALHDLSAT